MQNQDMHKEGYGSKLELTLSKEAFTFARSPGND
jgi:hypothetical protein